VPPVAVTVLTPPEVMATFSVVVADTHSPGAVALVDPAVHVVGLAVNAFVKEYETPSLAANPSATTTTGVNVRSGKPVETAMLSVGEPALVLRILSLAFSV
jgi:hypothetical protein